MDNTKVVYLSVRWEYIESVLPTIGFPPWVVMFLVVVDMSQPPSDFVSVFFPSVAISRVRLVSNLVVREFG